MIAGALLLDLQRDRPVSLHRQIESGIRDAIRSGRLPHGAVLPSTRTLAADLGVSRGTVVEAYQQLTAEGYLSSRGGGHTRVAVQVRPPRPVTREAARARPRIDFGYGRADVSSFPRATWLRSLRRVVADAPDERLGYLGGRGALELREALAGYLNRVRGTEIDPDDMVICSGYAQGVSLVLHVARGRGARRLAVEDPTSQDDAVRVARALGMEVVGVPVGDDGVDVAALAVSDADVVVLTPSHQWPLGGVLPPASRAAVLEWAGRRGAIVVEDDYDAEYRYDRAPIGAMQGLAPDCVVHSGSVSKTLAPGLRLGWLAVPHHLADAVAEAKLLADRGSPTIDQLACADFLERGELDRHLRRMRPVYRRRRDVLLGALRERLPDLEPTGVSAGIHLVAWLPPDLDEEAVVAAAAERGVGVAGLRPYRLATTGPDGLIFGYSSLGERAIVEGVALLAEAVAELRSG